MDQNSSTDSIGLGTHAYMAPDELIVELLADGLPVTGRIVQRSAEEGVDCAEVEILTEVYEGQEIYMHGWLARPAALDEKLPAALVIPGGRGVMDRPIAVWIARKCNVLVLAVDWIGAGKSTVIPGIDAWANEIRFAGEDYRTSHQFHNLRALLRATEYLLSQPDADPNRLVALGGSWGGFYSWLLAGIDQRFTHIFPTFGCGFLDTESRNHWQAELIAMGPERAEQWLRAFDPGRRAHLINAKVFFQQATNDKFYSLVASMKTFERVRSEKHLLLVRNQDHFTEPYKAQDVALLEAVVARRSLESELPRLHGVKWLAGTNLVEIDATDSEHLRLSVVYSFGRYTTSFGRWWREAPAELRDGRWVAEIPIVDVGREVWVYGHAVQDEPLRAVSTPVRRYIPAAVGVTSPTASFEPGFDFASDSFWSLPIGDRQHPEQRLVEEDGVTALAMRFDGDTSRRGIAFCLEGDLIEQLGYDGIEALVRVPLAEDVQGLKLCLVTDFHALAEQTYVFDLERLGLDLTRWQRVRVPFSEFEPHVHRVYSAYNPPLRPLEVGRLCGVGFFHADRDGYRGEALLANPSVVHTASEPAPLPQTVQSAAHEPQSNGRPADLHPYDVFVPTELSADELLPLLQAWEPWRQNIVFSNGLRTGELRRSEVFFVEHPVEKWWVFEQHIPEEALRGRALDVGSNVGHYSLFLRQRFGMEVVGVEKNPRHLEVARFLADTAGLDRITFLEADASYYRSDDPFDLIVHFETLDHLKNPFLALENAAAMLRPGGYLALECQTYHDESDERLCKFARPGRDGPATCWWFLGKQAVLDMLDEAGFSEVEVLLEWGSTEKIGERMRRLHVLAKR